MSATRILALLQKELLDLSRTRAAVMPGIWTLLTLVVPFVIAIGVPGGHRRQGGGPGHQPRRSTRS